MGPKYRMLVGTIIGIFYALGEALLGLLAMTLEDWRWILRAVYAPAFLIILYPLLIPESVRWLITQGRVSDAIIIIRKAAKVNKRIISDQTNETFNKMVENIHKSNDEEQQNNISIWDVFKHRSLIFRLINCSLSWATSTFVFYGLNIASVSIGSNKYESFIYVALIEIPALILLWIMANKLGRVSTLSSTMFASGIACLGTIFIDSSTTPGLILFLFGKFAITIALSSLYIFTAELFPTPFRHRLFGICAMFGRLGMIIAPQMPLLATYSPNLPMSIFCGTAIFAGILATQLPETLKTDLPDTIEDAINMQQGRCHIFKC